MRIRLALLFALSLAILTTACGGGGGNTTISGGGSTGGGTTGGGGTGTTNNTAQLIVDSGPTDLLNLGVADENLAFITATVCNPGTTTCVNIDHVQVDTGSEGLRLLPQYITSLSLPTQTVSGSTVNECLQFADGSFFWGPLATADIQIAGEVAKSVPVQIASNAVPPTSCSNTGSPQIEDVSTLGAHAIIGVGPFLQDCGGGCALPVSNSNNPGIYYSCVGSTCNQIAEPVVSQVQNPVSLFATDNNGVLLHLPAIPTTGAPIATGNLIFGIGTQSDNALGSATVTTLDPGTGNFAAQFNGVLFNDFNGPGTGHGAAFLDSGSNGLFFLDSATLTNQFNISMPDCPTSGIAKGFYCPSGLTAINNLNIISESPGGSGIPTGTPRAVTFNVQNAVSLFQTQGSAFNDVGGENSNTFDFGLPFFYGLNVFTAFEGKSTPAGTGPYVAF